MATDKFGNKLIYRLVEYDIWFIGLLNFTFIHNDYYIRKRQSFILRVGNVDESYP